MAGRGQNFISVLSVWFGYITQTNAGVSVPPPKRGLAGQGPNLLSFLFCCITYTNAGIHVPPPKKRRACLSQYRSAYIVCSLMLRTFLLRRAARGARCPRWVHRRPHFIKNVTVCYFFTVKRSCKYVQVTALAWSSSRKWCGQARLWGHNINVRNNILNTMTGDKVVGAVKKCKCNDDYYGLHIFSLSS